MADNSGHRLAPRGGGDGGTFFPDIINASTLLEFTHTSTGTAVQLNVTVKDRNKRPQNKSPVISLSAPLPHPLIALP